MAAKNPKKGKAGKAKNGKAAPEKIVRRPSVVDDVVAIDRAAQLGQNGLLDNSIAALLRENREKQMFEGVILSRDETIAQLICLPMPALAPRFLLQGEGWPLGRFTFLSGFQESCKSAFLSEVGTWHRGSGGNYVIIEAEDKDGSDLRDSFFDYDRKAWTYTRAETQEKWHQAFFFWVERLRKIMDGFVQEVDELDKKTGKPTGKKKKEKVPGLGRIAPVALGVDAISAVVIESVMEGMLEEGSPSLSHPVHAKFLSDFLKVGPKKLYGYPMSFLAVSHQKEKQQPKHLSHLPPSRVTSGGFAPKFHTSQEIEMRRLKPGQMMRKHDKYGEIYSIDLEMRIHKNSLGAHQSIRVEMAWYFDPENPNPLTGEKRQKSYFDWHSSSIELLLHCSQSGEAGKGFLAPRAKALRELVGLQKDGENRQVWSKPLGIGDKSRLSYFEAGRVLEAKIQADPEFRHQLYEIMGIRRRRMFQPGIDYLAQIDSHFQDLVHAEEEAIAMLRVTAEVPLPADPDAPAPPPAPEVEPAPALEPAAPVVVEGPDPLAASPR